MKRRTFLKGSAPLIALAVPGMGGEWVRERIAAPAEAAGIEHWNEGALRNWYFRGESVPHGEMVALNTATLDVKVLTSGEGTLLTEIHRPDGTVLKLKPTDEPDTYRVLSVERPDIEAQRVYLFGTFEPELPA